MGRLDVSIDRGQLAECLSLSLQHVAVTLDAVVDPETFVATLEMNGSIWREIECFIPLLGWDVPEEAMALSMAAASRARTGVDHQTVEAIIAINRRVVRRLAEA